ncbi:hypothetical protein NMG60_11030622 [Bertholletia excelsa]
MGVLVTFHEVLIGPHLGKMVGNIVKRLKDPDSVVRDACVETIGILASKLTSDQDENGVFVALVKPLFEALGEQNKLVQFGAALCLARVIDNIRDPPVAILQKMLTRTIKLLKNPHFMAKPAVIELNRSIIQAGGAPTQNILSAALRSIQEALKNSDWTTRKAASVALGEIASGGGSFFSPFKASCIRSLESCRFDKVKPVRDTVLHALHLWRSLPGPDETELSETGSSIKENYSGGDYGDVSSASEFGWKDGSLAKLYVGSIKKRIPLSVRKAFQSHVENPQLSKPNDWNIKIAVQKTQNDFVSNIHNDESEGSSVTKTFERVSTDMLSAQDIGCEYVSMDDGQESSSVSNLVTSNYDTKVMSVHHDCLKEADSEKQMGMNQHFAGEEVSSEEPRYTVNMQDHRSLDSTVTVLSSQAMHDCCLQTANEVVSIRKQLLEIENKQLNLMDMFKVFTTGIMDSLSTIQLKVSGLENIVDQIAQALVHDGRNSDLATAKLLKKSPSIVSPRLSTCSPRQSIDIRSRHPSLLPNFWEEKAFARSRPSISATHGINIWQDHIAKPNRNPIGKGGCGTSGPETHFNQTRNISKVHNQASATCIRQDSSEIKDSPWKLVTGYLLAGDLDSAYAEALSSGDELVLIELLDRTGPVLESLSQKTASDVLSTSASYILEQRSINSLIPWLQQVVDLSTIHGPNYLGLSAKARQEFLSAIQESLALGFSNPSERRSITQMAIRLRQIWGKCSW